MSRLIDADHLKKWILSRWKSIAYNSGMSYAINAIYEQIDREFTIEPEPHWISVTERLPEMDTRVLCTVMSGEFFDVEFGRLVKAGWLMERYGNHNNVIAWMPVPEHYKLRQGGT